VLAGFRIRFRFLRFRIRIQGSKYLRNRIQILGLIFPKIGVFLREKVKKERKNWIRIQGLKKCGSGSRETNRCVSNADPDPKPCVLVPGVWAEGEASRRGVRELANQRLNTQRCRMEDVPRYACNPRISISSHKGNTMETLQADNRRCQLEYGV